MSYTRSTGFTGRKPGCRQPDGKNVLSGVDVPVVQGAAIGARPVTRPETQGGQQVPAFGARLAAGVEAVNHDQALAVPLRLVAEELPKLSPTGVADGLGEAMVADHVLHGEVFDHDHVIGTDDTGGFLMQEVAPGVSDLCVDTGDLAACLVAVGRTALFASEDALVVGESLFLLPQVLRMVDGVPVTGDGERSESEVQPDHCAGQVERFHRVLKQHRHEPAARCIAGHRDRGRGTVWHRTRKTNVERVAHLRQMQLTVKPAECTGGVFDGLAALAGFETRISGTLGEEVGERRLLMPQGLLQRHGGHLLQERRVWRLLERGQHCGHVVVAQRLSLHPICTGALRECPVPYETGASHRSAQHGGLFLCGVEPELVRLLHTISVAHVRQQMKVGSAGSSPCLKAGVSPVRLR